MVIALVIAVCVVGNFLFTIGYIVCLATNLCH